MTSIGKDYLDTVIKRLRYYKDLGEKAIAQLNDEQIHYVPNPTCNSVAIIVQHMVGNMLSRWTNFLTEDGEKEWRKRDEEFEPHSMNKTALLQLWEQGWLCFLQTLQALKKKDLKRTVFIRQEPLTVTDAINRQLAHYPYHIGQIILMGKLILDQDWKNLSIPKGGSGEYNAGNSIKDPAKKY